MTTLIERILTATAGTPREFWPKVIAQQAQGGAWDLFDALAALTAHETREDTPTPCGTPRQARWRLPPRTRLDRWGERPEAPTGRWVDQVSLDPVVDWTISDGAMRCLNLVMSLAGGTGRAFITLTSSIAKQLGRTARTVQNYWIALAEAGYIERSFDRRSGLVTVTVTDLVKPPPLPEKPKPWPRLPNPKAGWKRIAREGAKFVAHIKAKASESVPLEESVLAAEAHFRPG
jgi:hypothetical protein